MDQHDTLRVVLFGLLCTLVLAGALFVVRGRREDDAPLSTPARPSLEATLFGAFLVLAAAYPLLSLAPWVQGTPRTFWGDAGSHARVAAEIASTLLPHGWISSYTGGFPFGHHYPQLGWLLLSALIRIGVSPVVAVHLLGFCATLATPYVLYAALVRCCMRPAFACIAAAYLLWVSPYNAFVGGYETFFSAGLLSQALGVPLCLWLAIAVIKPASRWEAPIAAWLCMASHPQVTVATLVVLGIGVLVAPERALLVRGLRAGAVALLAGAALYAQGVMTLDVPFGWPPDLGWRQTGFGPDRLAWWFLDGDLLDLERAPVLTALLGASWLILVLAARSAACRAVATALVAAVLLGVSGQLLLRMGRLGELLLSFLQPLRVLALIPPLAAVAVGLALESAAPRLARACSRASRPRLANSVPALLALITAVIACVALPSRLSYSDAFAALLRGGGAPCSGEPAPRGYDRETQRQWLAALSGGRLWHEAHRETKLKRCLILDGLELASAVPTGTASAVGAHVGVLSTAAKYLAPERAGSARRAQALGIGHLLLERSATTPLPGWRMEHQQGDVQLLSQPASIVAVGCIRTRWSGPRRQLRDRLNEALATPEGADALLDPERLTTIEYTEGPFVARDTPADDCNAAQATITLLTEEPGALSAEVQNPSPVDVVFRLSAFPTWRVSVDGAEGVKPTLIAPGFFSVRVPAGAHRLAARVSLMPGYGALITLALLVSATIGALDAERARSLFTRLRLLAPRPR